MVWQKLGRPASDITYCGFVSFAHQSLLKSLSSWLRSRPRAIETAGRSSELGQLTFQGIKRRGIYCTGRPRSLTRSSLGIRLGTTEKSKTGTYYASYSRHADRNANFSLANSGTPGTYFLFKSIASYTAAEELLLKRTATTKLPHPAIILSIVKEAEFLFVFPPNLPAAAIAILRTVTSNFSCS